MAAEEQQRVAQYNDPDNVHADIAMDTQHTQHTQDDINDILKRKRKVREHKACFPCRTRKVKCDSQQPCKTCVERNHPEICHFHTPAKRADTGTSAAHQSIEQQQQQQQPPPASAHGVRSSGSNDVTMSRDDWERFCFKLHNIERTLSDLKHDLGVSAGRPDPTRREREESGSSNGGGGGKSGERYGQSNGLTYDKDADGPTYVRAMEVNEQSHLSGEIIHLGGGSVPALVMALGKRPDGKPPAAEVFGNTMLPLFGLDNESATYPFVSLWGTNPGPEARMAEIMKTLPGDAECLETFRQYRDGPHVIYPAIIDIDQMENNLLTFLANRRASRVKAEQESSTDQMYGMPLQWVSLLFSAFASAAQFAPVQKHKRDLLSQVYVCCSFECLRMMNYLGNPSLDTISALLALGSVLANAMNAGAAWCLVGLTIRFAQSIGLNSACEIRNPGPKDVARAKTWWMVMWQDSLLSISYDRASSAAAIDCPYPQLQFPEHGRTFAECMYAITKIGLETVRNRVKHQTIEERLNRCVELLNEHQHIQSLATEHLKNVKNCKSMKEQSEYWALYLHVSYMNAELCRPAISPSTAAFDQTNYLRKLCIDNLMKTVEAFLGLANVSPIYTRSWGVAHRVLSSALLLGILGEPMKQTRARDLLNQLVSIMKKMATISDGSELSPPIARSINAVEKLCAYESRTRLSQNTSQFARSPSRSTARESTTAPAQNNNDRGGTSSPRPNSYAGSASNEATTNSAQGEGQQNAGGSSVDPSDPAFFMPTPMGGFEDESSPYALMDSIIWGGPRPAQ